MKAGGAKIGSKQGGSRGHVSRTPTPSATAAIATTDPTPEPVADVADVAAMAGEKDAGQRSSINGEAASPLSAHQQQGVDTSFLVVRAADSDEEDDEDEEDNESGAFDDNRSDDFMRLVALTYSWLERNKVVYRYDNRLHWRGSLPANPTYEERVAHRDLKLRDIEWAIRVEARGQDIPFGALKDIIYGWVRRQREERRAVIARRIYLPAGQKADPEPGFNALVAMARVRFPAEIPEFVAAVFEEIIWQIKRKMARLPVKHPYLFSIYSAAQDTGKSTLCADLSSPLEDLRRKNVKVKMLTEGKNHQIWDYPTLILDEMDQTSPASIAVLKNIVTNEELNFRPNYTNANETVDNEVTFYGSANHRIIAMFGDPTGMRRYVELLHAERAIRNWPEAIAVTEALRPMWADIWRNIDPERDSPIKERGFDKHLTQRQKEMTPAGRLSPFQEWVSRFDPEDPRYLKLIDASDYIKSSDLFNEFYLPWAKRCGLFPLPSLVSFGREMKSAFREDPTGFVFVPKEKASGTFYAYRSSGADTEDEEEDV